MTREQAIKLAVEALSSLKRACELDVCIFEERDIKASADRSKEDRLMYLDAISELEKMLVDQERGGLVYRNSAGVVFCKVCGTGLDVD